jgi:hypothetical protein
MRNPNGIRTESAGSPNASRAGALHSHIHIHNQRQNPPLTFANADTREDSHATHSLPANPPHRDAGEQHSTRWLR